MTTQERIKAAELRIKELQTLIQYLKNEKWYINNFSKHWKFFDRFSKNLSYFYHSESSRRFEYSL